MRDRVVNQERPTVVPARKYEIHRTNARLLPECVQPRFFGPKANSGIPRRSYSVMILQPVSGHWNRRCGTAVIVTLEVTDNTVMLIVYVTIQHDLSSVT